MSAVSDWLALAFFGCSMALCAALIDSVSSTIFSYKMLIVRWIQSAYGNGGGTLPTMFAFVALTCLLVCLAACIVHYLSTTAIGSGMPELKSMLTSNCEVKGYLSVRTLLSKIAGLTLAIGSGLPFGKMGPFVHIAVSLAHQQSRWLASLVRGGGDGVFANESRRSELFSTACAVGVACSSSTPIGGVLFSLETTTLYHCLHNYWRAFFAAVCGAATIRLALPLLSRSEVTVIAFYQTHFRSNAYDADELPLFVLLGLLCGLAGAFYVFLQRQVVLFLRNNRLAKRIFQQHWSVYPFIMSVAMSGALFPFEFMRIRVGASLHVFLVNCSWLECSDDALEPDWLVFGQRPMAVIGTLLVHIVLTFAFSAICTTLPVPGGIFGPMFVCGASIGRLTGECIALLQPQSGITPGVYAMVGAASLAGAVTHSISVAVIVFEMTGSLYGLLPVMIAVLVANAVASHLCPPFFDSIIQLKQLPYMPHLISSLARSKRARHLCAEQLMHRPIVELHPCTTLGLVVDLLVSHPRIRSVPVVSPENGLLMGSVSRDSLLRLLRRHIGAEARREEAFCRVQAAIASVDQQFQETHQQQQQQPSPSSSDRDRPVQRAQIIIAAETCQQQCGRSKERQRKRSALARRNAVYSSRDHSRDAGEQEEVVDGVMSGEMRSRKSCESLTKDAHATLSTLTSKAAAKSQQHRQHFGRLILCAKRLLEDMHLYKSEHDSGHRRDLLGLYDLTLPEQLEWEAQQLSKSIELTADQLDEAPFQIVRKTSLPKLHSLFGMLDLDKAYVTECGRLVGVVDVSDVRRAIESPELFDTSFVQTLSQQQQQQQELPVFRRSSGSSAERELAPSPALIDILTPLLQVEQHSAGRRSDDQVEEREKNELLAIQLSLSQQSAVVTVPNLPINRNLARLALDRQTDRRFSLQT